MRKVKMMSRQNSLFYNVFEFGIKRGYEKHNELLKQGLTKKNNCIYKNLGLNEFNIRVNSVVNNVRGKLGLSSIEVTIYDDFV